MRSFQPAAAPAAIAEFVAGADQSAGSATVVCVDDAAQLGGGAAAGEVRGQFAHRDCLTDREWAGEVEVAAGAGVGQRSDAGDAEGARAAAGGDQAAGSRVGRNGAGRVLAGDGGNHGVADIGSGQGVGLAGRCADRGTVGAAAVTALPLIREARWRRAGPAAVRDRQQLPLHRRARHHRRHRIHRRRTRPARRVAGVDGVVAGAGGGGAEAGGGGVGGGVGGGGVAFGAGGADVVVAAGAVGVPVAEPVGAGGEAERAGESEVVPAGCRAGGDSEFVAGADQSAGSASVVCVDDAAQLGGGAAAGEVRGQFAHRDCLTDREWAGEVEVAAGAGVGQRSDAGDAEGARAAAGGDQAAGSRVGRNGAGRVLAGDGGDHGVADIGSGQGVGLAGRCPDRSTVGAPLSQRCH